MSDVDELVRTVFSGLSPLVIEDVADQGERILIRARTPAGMVACPGCGALTERVHGYHERVVADVPVDARRVVLQVRCDAWSARPAAAGRPFGNRSPACWNAINAGHRGWPPRSAPWSRS